MAEIGAIANGVALASILIQVGDGLLRFKRFWNDVKSAPEEVSYLLEEVEAQYLVISEISHQRNHLQITSTSATKCVDLYLRTASSLEKLANELGKEIQKRKLFGGVKATLKKGTIDRLRERLRSIQMLMLLLNQAYLGYNTSTIRASHFH